jgi:predicted permease
MAFLPRLGAFVRRRRRSASWETTLHHELQAYLDHEVDARVAAGMSPMEARRTALAEFGGIEPVKAHVRAGASGAWVDVLSQDLRYAYNTLRQSGGFAAWIVGSLALGMAVMIAAFAFLIALLLGPFPHVTQQERLVRLSLTQNCGAPDCRRRMSSSEDLVALRQGLAALQGLSGYTYRQVAVGLPEARSFRGVLSSGNYFDVLGIRPVLGRMFDVTDEQRRSAVAVIAHRVWTNDFGADPSVIGRSMRVGDEFVQIIGVAPEFFVGVDFRPARGDRGPDVWLPLWVAARVLPQMESGGSPQQLELEFVGRLRDGSEASHVRAQAEMLARQLGPTSSQARAAVAQAQVVRLWRTNPANWSSGALLIMPVPILVLMIACLNAANLMLARASQRRQEIAVRLAIGAGRGRVIRQLLIESALLTLIATVVAVSIAWSSLQLARTPLIMPIPIDVSVLAFTVLMAALTTIAFGLSPALRVSAQPLAPVLGSSGAGSEIVPQQLRVRRGLLLTQVALSIGLLATAWQLVSTVRSQAVSGGTRADRLLIARFDMRSLNLPAGEAEGFYRRLVAEASRLSGAEATGLARQTAIWTFNQRGTSGSIVVWRPGEAPGDGRVTRGGFVGGDVFNAVGLRMVEGRPFTEDDRQSRPQVAIVTQAFARTMTGPAVGSMLRVGSDKDFLSSIEVRIVGVIESPAEPRLDQDGNTARNVYLAAPLGPEPALTLYLRTGGAATALAQPLRELVTRIDPRVPIMELGSLEDLNEQSFAPQLWLARAAALFGMVGLLLASAGLYGVSSYIVAMRSREMAIRMAMGARPSLILTTVAAQSLRLAATGLLIGGGIAIGISRVIQAEYHGIPGLDGAAFGGAATLFIVTMLLASGIPALRASTLNPAVILKGS